MIPDPEPHPGRLWDPHLAADPVLMRPMLLIALVAITIAVPFILVALLGAHVLSAGVEVQLCVAALPLFGGGIFLVAHLTRGGGWVDGIVVVAGLVSGLMVGVALRDAVRSH